MKRCFPVLAAFLLVSLLPAIAFSDEVKFANWRELNGKEGRMCTVFEGTEIECIRVKYIGTTPHPASPSERAILIMLLDEKRAPQYATPIAGTSGSPVYFEFKIKKSWWRTRKEWRLAGAAAFMFTDFPVGGTIMGVTPIEAMISGSVSSAAANLPTTIEVAGFGRHNIRWLPICIEPFGNKDDSFCFNRQAAPPPPERADGAPSLRRPMPGDSVTVRFTYGGGAICTVTYVRDNRFWACGHGLSGAAGQRNVSFLSYRTEIATVMFSSRSSYKLYSRDLELFGTIVKNTPFGIEGVVREK